MRSLICILFDRTPAGRRVLHTCLLLIQAACRVPFPILKVQPKQVTLVIIFLLYFNYTTKTQIFQFNLSKHALLLTILYSLFSAINSLLVTATSSIPLSKYLINLPLLTLFFIFPSDIGYKEET